jgi:hypothetical protein
MTDIRLSVLARRMAIVAALTLVSSLAFHAQALHAQQADSATERSSTGNASLVAFSTPAPVFHLSDTATPAAVSNSSSSSDSSSSTSSPVETERLSLMGDALQPPPRRTYGRPRYNDNSHNPDGSSKYTFEAGVGLTQPLGNTYHYLTPSYSFQVGFGRNFSKQFATLLQFDWDNFGFNGRTLGNQLALYDYGVSTSSQYYLSSLDGNSHVWSFTLNPKYTFIDGDKFGAYGVAGVGFYHKVANFTTPVQGTGYDYYYGFYTYTANETIDHYTSNAPGFNAGFGLTYKPSKFANERLFAEIRYDIILNSQRTGVTINSSSATLNSYTGTDFYPANSNRTTYLPIKFGIRF